MHTTLNSQRAGYQEEFTLLDPSGPATPVIHLASPSLAHPSALMSSAHPSVQPGSMPPDLLNDMQINASSMSLPVNTLDICCHLKASPWPHTKSRSSKIGQHHEKSKIFNFSSVLPISTIISFMDILKSQSHLCILPIRVPPGISPMSAILPLKHLKRLSPQFWSLSIGSQTLKSQSRLMPLTMHLLLSFPSDGELHPIAFCSQTFSAL